MIARATIVALAAAFVGALTLACEGETIVLAHIPAQDGGSSSGGPATRCATSADCGSGSYCSKNGCDDPAGTCAPLPVDCGDEHAPVCGCDGVSYFNDCLRRGAGVRAKTADTQCDFGSALFCGPTSPCPDGAYCAQVYGGPGGPGGPDCPHDVPGACWVVPAQCSPAPEGPNRYDVCGGGAQCVDSCTAIKSGRPFHRASPSDCPPPP